MTKSRSFRLFGFLPFLALSVLPYVAGCSGSSAPNDVGGAQTGGQGGLGSATGGAGAEGGAGGSAAGTHGGTATFDGSKIEAQILVRSVQPGAEQHVCVVVELPNTKALWVTEVEATLSGGSHHMIADRQPPGTALELDPTPCAPTMASDSTRLMIAQQTNTKITLPAGAAFAIAPHQPLFLQLHYFNAGSAVRDISGTLDLTVADPNAPTPTEALSIFTGTMSIHLAPHAAGQAQSFFVPQPVTGVRHVFALTSHTHHLGVDSTIERVASEAAPATTPIHESKSWDEPPLTEFSPPLDFTGSDGLRLICRYQNTTSATVTFGTSVSDEMCFMWVYYFDR